MKDKYDKLTGDLITKRGPGRPVTGKALTAAEKQKAYRARKKAEAKDYMTLIIHRDERELLIELVQEAFGKAAGDAIARIHIANLGRRLEALRPL